MCYSRVRKLTGLIRHHAVSLKNSHFVLPPSGLILVKTINGDGFTSSPLSWNLLFDFKNGPILATVPGNHFQNLSKLGALNSKVWNTSHRGGKFWSEYTDSSRGGSKPLTGISSTIRSVRIGSLR